ncbi:hypothetical protein [Hymenobacter bucti]|uniref:Acyltransferase 3 domain-containing protein n=1 Tax=Hymenobacter bucti TaxID=1844114 RepID=A0ABW4R290_9BACT
MYVRLLTLRAAIKLPAWGKLLLFLIAFYTLMPLAANYTGWPFSLLHQTTYERAFIGLFILNNQVFSWHKWLY